MDRPVLNKKFLDQVVTRAKSIYLDRANTDGKLFLTPGEINARAFIEAYEYQLQLLGYEITRVSKK